MKDILKIYREACEETFTRPRVESTPESRNRIHFIDLAKGLCILLVCILHSDLNEYMPPVFGLLRMPFYFFISGLFFKDYGSVLSHAVRKINKILIPAIFFYAVTYIFVRLGGKFGFMPLKEESFWSVIFNDIQYCMPVWFLFSLFFCNLIFCIIYRACNGRRLYIFFSVLACCSIGYILYQTGTRLFLYFDTSLTAMPFFFAGWCMRDINLLKPSSFDNKMFWMSVVAIAAIILIYRFIPGLGIDFRNNLFPESGTLTTYILGLIFIVATLGILKKIQWLPFLSYIGKYSLIVLCIHSQLLNIFNGAIAGSNGVAAFGLTLIVCWLAIPVLKEYLPGFTAQKDSLRIPSIIKPSSNKAC